MKNSKTLKPMAVVGIVVAVIVTILIIWVVAVFAGTAEIFANEKGPDTLLGAGFEEVGKYQREVEFRKGSELHGSEAVAFQEAFLEIKERLPEKSYFEIARFPEMPKYFVKLSDGHVYVAIGSGATVEAAFENLVANFK